MKSKNIHLLLSLVNGAAASASYSGGGSHGGGGQCGDDIMAVFNKKLQDAVTPGTGQISSGFVVNVVDKHGNTLYKHSAGTYGLNDSRPVDQNTLMWIASESKLMAAVGAMKMVELGLWDLDSPVDTHVHELKDMPLIASEYNSTVIKQVADKKVTLRHLMTHTNGMGYANLFPGYSDWRIAHGLHGSFNFLTPVTDPLPQWLAAPLMYEPGEGWSYGPGLDWTMVLVERVTGKHPEQWMREKIWGPLGMNDTTFDPSNHFSNYKERLMTTTSTLPNGTNPSGGGLATTPLLINIPQPYIGYGGHGGFSTPGDYIKLLTMVLRGGTTPDGTRILKQSTVDEMFTPQLHSAAALAYLKNTTLSDLGDIMGPSVGLPINADKKVNYGLSGLINIDDFSGYARKGGSLCWSGLPNLYWWVDPKSGITANINTQLSPTGVGPILQLVQDFENEIYKNLDKLKRNGNQHGHCT